LKDKVLTEEEIKKQFTNVTIPMLTLANKVPGNLHFERMEFMGDAVAKYIQTEIVFGSFPSTSVNVLFVNPVFSNDTERMRNCGN
jgi:dsRNA-specific ribonuclease